MLIQLDKTLEEFKEEYNGKELTVTEFKRKEKQCYLFEQTLLLHLEEGIGKIPVMNNQKLNFENAALLTEDEIVEFKNIVETYETKVAISKYIIENHHLKIEIPQSDLTIKEFLQYAQDQGNDYGEFMWEDIEFFKDEEEWEFCAFESEEFEAAFVYLKDGWLKVPIGEESENSKYITWYSPYGDEINKQNVNKFEYELKKLIKENAISQEEVANFRFMIKKIKSS